jgi:apolipoprotein N-acyltransferase
LRRAPRGALGDGWLLGTAFFLVLLRWLDHTFGHYSAIPWPLSWLPIVALAAYCGLYVGAGAAVTAWLTARVGRGRALALIPPVWVAGEWVRGQLRGGFPWGLLGYSQHTVLPVIQIAELTGVYGVSFVMAAVASAVTGLLGLGPRRAMGGAIGALALLLGSLGFGWHALARPQGAEPAGPRVAVIQPSVDQAVKWSPAHHAEVLARYEGLTRAAAARPS